MPLFIMVLFWYLLMFTFVCTFNSSVSYAATIVQSGTWGENITWTLNSDGLLDIVGTGKIHNGTESEKPNWLEYALQIKSLNIDNNITGIGDYAFNECKYLKTATLPNHLTYLGKNSFQGCSQLKLTSLPNGIEVIENYAFSGCSNLLLTSLPNTVIVIKEFAFMNCINMPLSSLPEGLMEIGVSAFNNCYKLSLTSLPDGINIILDYTFCGCEMLALTSLPSNITTIKQYAFHKCYNLALTSLPDSLASIGSFAFSRCYKLSLTSLPEGLTKISNEAFVECSNLKLTTLPSSLIEIGNTAFQGCYNIEPIIMPSNDVALNSNIFSECYNMTTILIPNGIRASSTAFSVSNVIDTKLYVSDSLDYDFSTSKRNIIYGTVVDYGKDDNQMDWIFDSDGVLIINGTGAMKDYTSSTYDTAPWYEHREQISKIEIGSYITHIGDYSFYGCVNLDEITIRSNITSIGENAYYVSSNKETVLNTKNDVANNYNWSSNNRTINTTNQFMASGSCGTSITWTLDYNGKLTLTGNGWMSNYTDDTSSPWNEYSKYILNIEFDNNIVSIGSYAFVKCTKVSNITLPENLEYIGKNAFTSCMNLKLTQLPSAVTYLGEYAFQNCSNLALTSLPSGITEIKQRTFENCSKLNLINLPTNITRIEAWAFSGCTNLKLTSLPENLELIGASSFRDCSNIVLTSIPEKITIIYNETFLDCSKLALTSLPEGIISIGDRAFKNCFQLTLASLPSSLTSIGTSAFSGCLKLALTQIPSGVTVIKDSTFSGCTQLALTSLSDNITSIEGWAFNGCRSMTFDSLPSELTQISNGAFYKCSKIRVSSLPSGIRTIGQSSFYDCDSITISSIPEGVTSIEKTAFGSCNNIASMTLPDSLLTIDVQAFEYNSQMTSISIGTGVTSIGTHAFDCSSPVLTTLTTTNEVALAYNWLGDNRYFDYAIEEIEDQEHKEVGVTPTITVKDVRGRELVLNTDYTVSYSNNKNIGMATVTVTGKGRYAGTRTNTFKIIKNTTAGISMRNAEFTYDGQAHEITGVVSTNPSGLELGYRYYASNGTTSIDKSTIKDVGTYYEEAYIVSTNYDVAPVRRSITILPRPLKLTGVTLNEKTYDRNGTVTANMTGSLLKGLTVEANGVVESDVTNVTLNSSGVSWSYVNYNATSGAVTRTAARSGDYTLTGTRAFNYELLPANTPSTLEGVINAKGIEVVVSSINKNYDGNTNATVTITPKNSIDIIEGDTVTFSYTTATFDNENVGEGKTVTVSGITSNNSNYSVTNAEGRETCTANIIALNGLVRPSATLNIPVKSGTYGDTAYSGTEVTLSLETAGLGAEVVTANTGASIYYAYGTNSSNNDIINLYSIPLTINANTSIRAVTRKTGYNESDVSTFSYTVRTIEHVLKDIDDVTVGNANGIEAVLENISERALLETDLELKSLLDDRYDINYTEAEQDIILTRVKNRLDETSNEKTFKKLLEEEMNVLDLEKTIEVLPNPAVEEIQHEHIEEIENAKISYERLTKDEKEKVKRETSEKLLSLNLKYEELLTEKRYTNTYTSSTNVDEKIELIGLLTKVDKTEDTNVLSIEVEKKDANELNVTRGKKVVLAYDIKIVEKNAPTSNTGTEVSNTNIEKVLLKVKVPKALEDKNPEVHHLTSISDEVNSSTKVEGQHIEFYDDIGYIVFEIESFSPFVITTTDFVTVYIEVGANGRVTPDGIREIEEGGRLTLNISPNTGYEVDKVTVNDREVNITNNTLNLTGATEDVTIKITFKKKEEASSGGGESGTGESSTVSNMPIVSVSGTSHIAYMSGYEDGTFKAEGYITREEIATIISRIDVRYHSYDNYIEKGNNYTDIRNMNNNYWAINYVGFVNVVDAMTGYTDGTFKPKSNITRGEMAVVLARYRGLQVIGKTSKFKDTQGKWLEGYVGALEEKGYVTGLSDGTYGVDRYITRAEACTMINSILGRSPDREKIKALGEEINKFKDVDNTRWYYADIMEATNDHPIALYN